MAYTVQYVGAGPAAAIGPTTPPPDCGFFKHPHYDPSPEGWEEPGPWHCLSASWVDTLETMLIYVVPAGVVALIVRLLGASWLTTSIAGLAVAWFIWHELQGL